jgi:uncharacterized protein YdeI (YjbR/CyaY-like superfamily)
MNPLVDQYLLDGCGRCKLGGTPQCKVHNWTAPLIEMRRIVLAGGFTEERKWGMPTYTWKGKNVVMVTAFKDNCVISFFKGALLSDPKNLLVMPGENSQAVRFLRFTDVKQVLKQEADIKKFLKEVIQLEESGKKVASKKADEMEVPAELTNAFKKSAALKKAFYALTPGRQRGYLLHFSSAKQSDTRAGRIEKATAKILAGKGMQD